MPSEWLLTQLVVTIQTHSDRTLTRTFVVDRTAPIALTMGEPAGIGGEIALMAWRNLRATGPTFFLIDDPIRITRLATEVGIAVPILTIENPTQANDTFSEGLPVLPIGMRVDFSAGRLEQANAAAVIRSIEKAVRFASTGAASAVVTNPIQKSVLYQAGFKFPGHTEYLGALVGASVDPVMMLASPQLKVVPVTIHVALRQAIALLTTELVVDRACIVADALVRDFGIATPRLAVLGLNPHAGENASMGTEDRDIIAPAIEQLVAAGIAAFGPLPPDTAFTTGMRPSYDAAICMYHDQGLIPLKTLDIDSGVNITLGLPIVRTSPDHGTALDIAGKGIANPGSLIEAIKIAASIASHRRTEQRK